MKTTSPSPCGDGRASGASIDGAWVNGCGHGAVSVVVPTASGDEVRGSDDSYGTWVS
jgi:hypothetical protein